MRRTWSLVLCALTSCTADLDLSSLSEPPIIACSSHNDCPPGMTCRTNLGRCVSNANEDTQAPELLEAVLSPTLATVGTEVSLQLTFNEALAAPPTVLLAGEPRFFVDVGASAPEAHTYVLRYTATPAAGEGVHALSVAMVDYLGNEGTAAGPVLTLDFTPPVVSDLAWSGADGRTSVSGSSSLLLQGRAEADSHLVAARLVSLNSDTEPVDITAAFTFASGDHGGVDVEGLVAFAPMVHGDLTAVEFVFADAAGNENPEGSVISSPWQIDNEPPTSPSIALLDGTVTYAQTTPVQVNAQGAVEVMFSGDVLDGGQWLPLPNLPFATTVVLAAAGANTVKARFRDGAHNETDDVENTITLHLSEDQEPPSLLSVTAINPYGVLLTFNEALNPTSITNLSLFAIDGEDGSTLSIDSNSLDDNAQLLTLTLADKQVGGVQYTVTILPGIQDATGNPTTTSASDSFVGLGPIPDPSPPGLIYPPLPPEDNRIFAPAVILRWQPRSTATSYTVRVAKDAGFSHSLSTYVLTAPDEFSPPPTELALEGLSDHTWYWDVASNIMEGSANLGVFEVVGSKLLVYCAGEVPDCSVGEHERAGNHSKPYQTIGHALREAASHGIPQVWVATRGGTDDGPAAYVESVRLEDGIALLGGYLADSNPERDGFEFELRNARDFETIIAHDGVITLAAVALHKDTLVEGFTIRGGGGPVSYNVFVADSKAGLIMRANRLQGGDSHAVLSDAYALYVVNAGTGYHPEDPRLLGHDSPVFTHNHIIGPQRPSGGANLTTAVYLSATGSILHGNRIEARGGTAASFGVVIAGAARTVLKNNVIVGPDIGALPAFDSASCYGIDVRGQDIARPNAVISNNTIHMRACGAGGDAWGIRVRESKTSLTNNIIFATDSGSSDSACVGVHPDNQLKGPLASLIYNVFSGCATPFKDANGLSANVNDPCQTTDGYVGTARNNVLIAEPAELGFRSLDAGDYDLMPDAPPVIRTGGHDTSKDICGAEQNSPGCVSQPLEPPEPWFVDGSSCGEVTVDFLDGERTSDDGYSRGAFEAIP